MPEDLSFTSQHEWLRQEGEVARVGITKFAADALGDVVYVDLPPAGATVAQAQPCGELESTKSVSDLFAPVDGEIVELNQDVIDNPGLVSSDPFGAGWLFTMRITGAEAHLLDEREYAALIEG